MRMENRHGAGQLLLPGADGQHDAALVHCPGVHIRLIFIDVVPKQTLPQARMADVYTRAMDKGGVVLTIRTEEEKLARAMTILHSHDSVDVPSRMQSSINNGNTAPGINPTAGKQFAGETNDRPAEPLRTSLTGDESEADILRLAEEQVEVGKRLVSEGSTRVRRYTVTDTVSEDISLHEQHADIFRRSVNEPALAGEVDWSEKTVEVAETHEQPVINKTTHVKEEVVVRTNGSDRTETINDTVRRQEVDIDHARGGLERDLPSTTAGVKPATAAAGAQSPAVHKRDHKESLTEKVKDKAGGVKDKVEHKLHDHSH